LLKIAPWGLMLPESHEAVRYGEGDREMKFGDDVYSCIFNDHRQLQAMGDIRTERDRLARGY